MTVPLTTGTPKVGASVLIRARGVGAPRSPFELGGMVCNIMVMQGRPGGPTSRLQRHPPEGGGLSGRDLGSKSVGGSALKEVARCTRSLSARRLPVKCTMWAACPISIGKPGKQPPGSSIAGSATRRRYPWSRSGVGATEQCFCAPDGLLGAFEHPPDARLLLPFVTGITGPTEPDSESGSLSAEVCI